MTYLVDIGSWENVRTITIRKRHGKIMTTNNDRKAMIQKGFDTVAAGYDHPALSFFPETAKRLINHLELNTSDNLLDVCTGTGVVALRAAEKITQGTVTGIDLSSGMLQQAINKALEKGFTNTQFQQMDLEAINDQTQGLKDNSYDVVTSSFGLFFLEDMTTNLQNIANKVKPGGKVAITSFTNEAFSPMSDIFLKHYEEAGKEVQPLSWKRLSTKEQLTEQFNAVGITNINIHHEPLGYQMTDAQIWWDVVWNTGYRSLLNQLTDEGQIAFKEKHLNEIAELVADGVWFNTEVLIAVGEKQK